MKLRLEHTDLDDVRIGGDVVLESYYIPPWDVPRPENIFTFEAHLPEWAGYRSSAISVRARLSYYITNTEGWVTGVLSTPRLPTLFAKDWETVLGRLYPAEKGSWKHSGVAPEREDIAVIPTHLPGGGMIIIRNQSTFLSYPYTTEDYHVRQQLADQAKEKALTALGFVRV